MILQVSDVRKVYQRGQESVEAVKGVNLSAGPGEFICIAGPSGSGKSTLLHLLGGLDRPTSGMVQVGDQALNTLNDHQLSLFRRNRLGFVFQFFNLLPTLSAEENVGLPLLLNGAPSTLVRDKVHHLLSRMGIADRARHHPSQLSGGEMQRVAIARALVNDPVLILADEPTGNLDTKTGITVLELLRELVTRENRTLVMVTHDPKAASYGTRLIQFRDGLIESDQRVNG